MKQLFCAHDHGYNLIVFLMYLQVLYDDHNDHPNFGTEQYHKVGEQTQDNEWYV